MHAAVAIGDRHAWDPDRLVTTEGNRWSAPGEPTIYLAGSPTVALAEFARHAPEEGPVTASLWSVRLQLDRVVDLTDVGVRSRLAAMIGRDTSHAYERRLAGDARRADAQAILVPSVPFLDRVTCWNLVVFADRLDAAITEVFRDASQIGSILITRPAGDGAAAS